MGEVIPLFPDAQIVSIADVLRSKGVQVEEAPIQSPTNGDLRRFLGGDFVCGCGRTVGLGDTCSDCTTPA